MNAAQLKRGDTIACPRDGLVERVLDARVTGVTHVFVRTNRHDHALRRADGVVLATDSAMNARIEKRLHWDQCAHVERTYWDIHLSGGPFDGQTKTVRTRREAREWCDEFGYDWHADKLAPR